MSASTPTLIDRVRGKSDVTLSTPVYIVTLALIVLPLGYLVYAALQTDSPGSPTSEFTWDNITTVATTASYWTALRNSLWLGFLVSLFSVILGVSFAWILGRTDVPFRGPLSVLVSLPIFLSPFAGGVAWVLLGSKKSGLINGFLTKWFGEGAGIVNIMSFPGLVFVMVLAFAPLAYLFTLGPMLNMDGSLEEASRVGGASVFHTMRKITLPVVLPGILSAALMVFVLAAEMFSIPGLIGTAAGYRTLPFFIYQNTTAAPPNWGGAAAAGLALLLIMLVGTLLQARATKTSSRFVTISGKGARPVTLKLGRWRWVAFLIPVLYVLVGVVLPAAALLLTTFLQYYTPNLSWDLFTLQNWETTLASPRFQIAVQNTIFVGSATPTIAVVIAFALSYIRNRTHAPFRATMEAVGMLPVAIPGIVFGVGVLWAYVGSPVYGTVWLLLIAYCARFLPHALRVISSGIVQVDKGLEEASRVAGAGVTKTMRSITIPLLKPTVLSGWLLLLIYCTRELNVAIMTYTSKSVVVPVLMWNEMSAGAYQKAAALAIIESTLILAAVTIAALVFRVNLFPRGK
ncbi:iron ABC transporter permease [Nocardioides sp. NBC_00850]|uniref:ABC transporter permease n=1 Tax=Nocardioides sp. NBC_00850 TaxID=2976001 RepID=UPI00386C7455|nr:iron ABC transporter permease [Nocardioides sp. NBC_00850]